jgi:hypothetical protein
MRRVLRRWPTLSGARQATVILFLCSAGLVLMNHWLWSIRSWTGIIDWVTSLACVVAALIFSVKPAKRLG